MSKHLHVFPSSAIAPFKKKRTNENHVADVIRLADPVLELHDNLQQAKEQGVKYIILGVPEDIGPRANCGNGGADKGWENFLPVFLNQQANGFFDWQQCMLLGHVHVDDLQKQSDQASCSDHLLTTLRALCEQVDARVTSVLTPIFEMGFEVIVIGGGHNNAYPIVSALHQATSKKVACVNMDPHADFRPMEGRHSGNPFRYAYEAGSLSHYALIGLHEQKNNQATIEGLQQANFPYFSYQDIFMTQTHSFEDALYEAREYISETSGPIGIELDLDSVKQAAASAYSVAGFSLEQAVRYVYLTATLRSTQCIHLCEGAPALHEHSEYGSHDVGQMLTQLVYAYLKARTDKEPELPL